MKRLILVGLIAFSSLVLAKEVTVEVKGMHCGGCEGLVEEALEGVPGVTSVKADAKAGRAVLQMSDEAKLDAAAIEKAVTTAGKRYSAGKISEN